MGEGSGSGRLVDLSGSRLLPAHVGDEEDDAEHDAESADDDVADRQEVVGTAEQVGRGQHEVLAAGKEAHVVSVEDLQRVGPLFQVVRDLTVELAEVGEAGGAHPNNEFLVLDVSPLYVLPVRSVEVFELELAVRAPGNVLVVDGDVLVVLPKLKRVVEDTLGDETTGEGRVTQGEIFSTDRCKEARVFVSFDGIAVVKLVHSEFVAHQLLIGARLDVATMVLVEVVKLVVHVDGSCDVRVDVDGNFALCAFVHRALRFVLLDDALDALTHDVQRNSKGQKDQAKNAEDDHRGTE